MIFQTKKSIEKKRERKITELSESLKIYFRYDLANFDEFVHPTVRKSIIDGGAVLKKISEAAYWPLRNNAGWMEERDMKLIANSIQAKLKKNMDEINKTCKELDELQSKLDRLLYGDIPKAIDEYQRPYYKKEKGNNEQTRTNRAGI